MTGTSAFDSLNSKATAWASRAAVPSLLVAVALFFVPTFMACAMAGVDPVIGVLTQSQHPDKVHHDENRVQQRDSARVAAPSCRPVDIHEAFRRIELHECARSFPAGRLLWIFPRPATRTRAPERTVAPSDFAARNHPFSRAPPLPR